MLPPLLNPARERATAAPLSDYHVEGDGGHARARKWPVSEYGRKRRRQPLREVPGLLCQRGARAQSVRAHLDRFSEISAGIASAEKLAAAGRPSWLAAWPRRAMHAYTYVCTI